MSLFSAIGSYEDAWKAIIMPWRQEYSLYDLGPVEFNAGDNRIKRTDFRLLNKRGQTIECSYFQQVNIDTAIPCVVYLHGNGCSRIEALHYSNIVLSKPVSYFCFDFSGCGKSEGQYTSVGWHEQEDLECVIQYLHNTGKVSKIAVWGRSMGAVTAILYANKDPRINCLIFDSPFSNFKQLVKELAKQKASIPGFIVTGAFSILRKTIISKANFDIDALRPIKYVDKVKVPALFGTAKGDDFVAPKHTKDLYMSYGGPKQLMMFEGDHNSQRPFNWMLMVQDFIKTQLLEEKDESQNTTKSFKQPFNPAEKTAEPTTTEIKTETNQTQQDQTPVKKPLPPSHQAHKQQNHMTFTWLDHSASSPNLSINKSLSQVSLSDKTVQESVDKENLKVEKSIPSEKRLQRLFADSKKENAGAKPLQTGQQNFAPKTAQINLDLSGKDLNKTETADKSPSLREHSRPVKFGQKENSGPQGEKLTKKTSSANLSGNSNISIFGPKKKEVRSENIFGSPLRIAHVQKANIALKEISTSHLDNASNIQSNAEAVPPPKALLRAGSGPVKSTTTKADKPNLSIPISDIQSSKPKERKNLTLMPTMLPIPPRQIDSQRDPKRIFEAGAQKQQNSTMTTRSPSKSLTIDMNALRASKENASPKQKQKTLLLQVKLNSDVPLINPSQAGPNANISYITQSLNNMSQLDSRRSSEITLRSYNSVPGENTSRNVSLGNELRGYRDNNKLPANLLDNSTVKNSGEMPPKGPQRDARNIHELVK